MSLSVKEFNIIIDELLNYEKADFTTLCEVAEKLLRKRVHAWCVSSPELFNTARCDEDDLMQEILIRLVKTTVSSFLLRNGVDGPINNDAEGFGKWMFTVAKNVKKDIANRERQHWLTTKYLSEQDADTLAASNSGISAILTAEERADKINKSFAAAIDSDAEVYKVLTWLAHSLFMLNLDVDRTQSKQLILMAFEKRTLFEISDMVFYAATKAPRLKIADRQKAKIEKALNKSYDDVRVYGAVRYDELFMQKGGKATISDWVHKMNKLVIRTVQADEALDI